MTNRLYRYPGDPTEPVTLMTGAEFKTLVPQREIRIVSDDEDVSFPASEVVCDSCNASVGDDDFCALAPTRLYCLTCYEARIQPFRCRRSEWPPSDCIP